MNYTTNLMVSHHYRDGHLGMVKNSKSFLVIYVCNFAQKDFRDIWESENIFVFKVPLVGTLNLCLRLPDNMQKTENQSVHSGLRKRPKSGFNWL